MVCNGEVPDSVTDTASLMLCFYEIVHFSALLKKTQSCGVNAAWLLLENFLNNLKIGASETKKEEYRS